MPVINNDTLSEIVKKAGELVKLTGMPCWVLGDAEENIIHGFVFGYAEAAEAAAEEIDTEVMFGMAAKEKEEGETSNDTTLN